MRILHIADVHLGITLRNFSRLEEQRRMLEEVTDLAVERQVDVIVIAGDVYDHASPPLEAVKLFDDFMGKIAAAGIRMVAIPGNHDSRRRMSYALDALAETGIHIVTEITSPVTRVVLEDEHGPVNFYALPFFRSYDVRPLCETVDDYNSAFRFLMESTDIDTAERNVLVAHQFFTENGFEAVRSDSEREQIGGLDAVLIGAAEKFDYIAMGHLHRAQKLADGKARYSGSPLKYSFSEVNHRKQVLLVELGAEGEVTVEEIPVTQVRDLRTLRGTFADIMKLPESEDYLSIELTDRETVIRAMETLRERFPYVAKLTYVNREEAELSLPDATADQTLDPVAMAEELYQLQTGLEAPEATMMLLKEWIRAVDDAADAEE